ncbi:hypothetical protein L1987_52999 [Smallanthus sonchifolius]|uniref:Uncharacterized protein n=1 Tax=Smallanthus sonchifolius TaxID=185202 RepID=A0ACB9EVW6_9ASTR|nr:hypothetical protein L1987_52999 [Smallanthus sonchifolius]
MSRLEMDSETGTINKPPKLLVNDFNTWEIRMEEFLGFYDFNLRSCNDLSSRHTAVSSKDEDQQQDVTIRSAASSVDAAEKPIRSNFGIQQIRLSAADLFFSRRTSIHSS